MGTGTDDVVTSTDTTDTTDAEQAVVDDGNSGESPVTRPQPGIFTRSYDAFCGVACFVAGGYLLGRAFGVISYPEAPEWQLP